MFGSAANRHIVCWVLTAAEVAILGHWAQADHSWENLSWSPALLLVVIGACVLARYRGFRRVLRVIAGLHVVAAIFAVPVFLRSIPYEEMFAGAFSAYILLNVTLPAMVVGLLPIELRDPAKLELPLGYEHLDPERYRLTPLERLVLILGMSLAIPTFMMGGVLLSVIWLPVVFAAYWLVRIVRTARPTVSKVGRHLRLEPEREYPVQTQSYWTVNSSEFRDSTKRG